MNLYCGKCRELLPAGDLEEVIVDGDPVLWCQACVRKAK